MKSLKRLFLLVFVLIILPIFALPQSPVEISEKSYVLGKVHTIKSAELGENRELNIYLPNGYYKNKKQKYPVIYLLDGSADEDFIHIAGLMQFANFPWVKLLPPSILVGVANVDRRRDFTYPTTIEKDKKQFPTTGGSAKFIAFIEKELQPFIENKYRTNSSKTIIGQSLGGLLATEILFKKPKLFNRYMIVSPSLWWDNQSLLKVKPKRLNGKTSVYVAVGKEGEIMERDARSLHSLLEKRKMENLQTSFGYFPDEDHGSILHLAVYDAFKKFRAKKEISAKQIYDHHVHLMSPRLIKYFKDLGIPFSKPDADYSDLNAVSKRLGTRRFTLVSMAYMFGHPEFGKLKNEYETVKAENDYVIKAREKSSQNIKVFCAINPLKSYALMELKRCNEKLKADGIKIHSNANQIYLTEPTHLAKIKAIYEYAAENNMPILLHFDNSHPKFGEPDIKLFVDKILANIKPATFQIAHFGTSGGFNAKTKRVINAFIKQFETNPNIKKHKIMFDISAVGLDKNSEGVPKLTDEQFAELATLARKIGFDKIVFGTDYPLYSAEEYLKILKTRLKLTDKEIETMLKN